ncbi:transducin/WD40 repeat-like superfamily protein [Wolffia australiana]
MTNGDMGEETAMQLQVRFVTKLPPPLKVAARSIAVPVNLTRMGLSEIVNHILGGENSDHQPLPLDFLVGGELVRMPLDRFLLAKGISAEKVLEIEYIKAVIPRKQDEPYPHDDWVSAVDGSNKGFILTGCYDGFARIWKDGAVTHLLEGHNDAITSACIINKKDMIADEGTLCIGTASKDRSLRLWKICVDEPAKNPRKVEPSVILNGHTSAVQSISSGLSGDMLCSGSWDCSIKLWSAKEGDLEEDKVSLKKRKSGSDQLQGESQLEGSAVSTLNGHTQCVSSVVWAEPQSLYSASWDHSVRRWDISTGGNTWNMVCGKALNCVDVGGEGSALVAAGGSDPVLRIWDPRRSGNIAPVYQFSSHASWISSCKWHPKSWLHLMSTSYDGKAMIWDLRTAWPLAVINSHSDKVLCADWWGDDSVATGGADSKLFISAGISVS